MSRNAPYVLDMKPGIYAWCACGLSKNQPFCDGSHSSTPLRPMIVHLTEDKKIAWCGCKASNKKPYCDGTHKNIGK